MKEVLNASLYLAIESYSGSEAIATVMITEIETDQQKSSINEPLKTVVQHYKRFNVRKFEMYTFWLISVLQ